MRKLEQECEKSRGRFTVDTDAATYEAIKMHLAKQGPNATMADFHRKALAEYLAKLAEGERSEAAPVKGKRESKKDRQKRFLIAVEEKFGLVSAAKLAEISRSDVTEWMRNQAFADAVECAQEAYTEGIEQTLLDMAAGRVKGQFMPLIAWLNAHHPQYGRIKGEVIARILGPMMERFYKLSVEIAGEETGEAINRKMREVAEGKLSELTD
jgi:hypothetical protein